MGWMSEQSTYKREREAYKKHTWGSYALQEQEDIFYSHIDAVKDVAIRVDEVIRNEGLKEDQVMLTRLCELKWPNFGVVVLSIVLRDDGFVYFGVNESLAILGLGGRFKDGQFEFYDQYKKELDQYQS